MMTLSGAVAALPPQGINSPEVAQQIESDADHLGDILGFTVVTQAEGSELGRITALYIDPELGKLCAVALRTHRLSAALWVKADDIIRLGRDVILIRDESAVESIDEEHTPPGRSLAELRGIMIATSGGKHLGRLTDIDIDDDWRISVLILDGNQKLGIEMPMITIGPDQIVVPPSYVDRITEMEPSEGFMTRVLGEETVESMTERLQSVLEKMHVRRSHDA